MEIALANGNAPRRLLRHIEARDRENMRMCVYVFPSREYVKIGISRNADERWSELRTANPFLEPAVFVSELIKGARKIEESAHAFLHPYRVTGEWFKCSRYLAVEVVKTLIDAV